MYVVNCCHGITVCLLHCGAPVFPPGSQLLRKLRDRVNSKSPCQHLFLTSKDCVLQKSTGLPRRCTQDPVPSLTGEILPRLQVLAEAALSSHSLRSAQPGPAALSTQPAPAAPSTQQADPSPSASLQRAASTSSNTSHASQASTVPSLYRCPIAQVSTGLLQSLKHAHKACMHVL